MPKNVVQGLMVAGIGDVVLLFFLFWAVFLSFKERSRALTARLFILLAPVVLWALLMWPVYEYLNKAKPLPNEDLVMLLPLVGFVATLIAFMALFVVGLCVDQANRCKAGMWKRNFLAAFFVAIIFYPLGVLLGGAGLGIFSPLVSLLGAGRGAVTFVQVLSAIVGCILLVTYSLFAFPPKLDAGGRWENKELKLRFISFAICFVPYQLWVLLCLIR